MSANTANAVKAHIESLGLGVAVYRDAAPLNTPLPVILVHEGISIVPEPAFNSYDDPEGHVRELVQVDIWQMWRDLRTGAVLESFTIPDAVIKGLRGANLSALGPTRVSGVTVQGIVRTVGNPLPNAREATSKADNDKVGHAITIEIRRTLTPV